MQYKEELIKSIDSVLESKEIVTVWSVLRFRLEVTNPHTDVSVEFTSLCRETSLRTMELLNQRKPQYYYVLQGTPLIP